MSMIDDAKMVMPFLRAVVEGKEILYRRREAVDEQWLPLNGVEDIVGAVINGFTCRVAPPKTYVPLGRSQLRQLIGEHLVKNDNTMHICCGVRINEQNAWLVTMKQVGLISLAEYTPDELLSQFRLVDGTPCGMIQK